MRRTASAVVLLVATVATTLPACTWEGPGTQPLVSALLALMPKRVQDVPPEFREGLAQGKRPGVFDPNCYFAVLSHLSMQEGYSLDWVYAYDGTSGEPMLCAVRSGERPAAEVMGYTAARACANALEHVMVDGTEAAYTELVILQTVGVQFYLLGDAVGRGILPIYEKAWLDSAVKCLDFMGGDPQRLLQLSPADREPQVVLDAERAEVSVFRYRAGEGLSRLTYVYERQFPHRLVGSGSEVVVSYQ
jgi:hypothetical protein